MEYVAKVTEQEDILSTHSHCVAYVEAHSNGFKRQKQPHSLARTSNIPMFQCQTVIIWACKPWPQIPNPSEFVTLNKDAACGLAELFQHFALLKATLTLVNEGIQVVNMQPPSQTFILLFVLIVSTCHALPWQYDPYPEAPSFPQITTTTSATPSTTTRSTASAPGDTN